MQWHSGIMPSKFKKEVKSTTFVHLPCFFLQLFTTFAVAKTKLFGAIAQLVEQRTENPCVPGSIPGGTTKKESYNIVTLFFCGAYNQNPCITKVAEADTGRWNDCPL